MYSLIILILCIKELSKFLSVKNSKYKNVFIENKAVYHNQYHEKHIMQGICIYLNDV